MKAKNGTQTQNVDWRKVDFDRPSNLIADELGVKCNIVTLARRLMAPETSAKFRTRAKCDWPKVDWSKRNVELAHLLGVSIGLICTRRKLLAPQTRASKNYVDWSSVDWSKRTCDIAKDTDRRPTTVSQKRRLLAPKTVEPRGRKLGSHNNSPKAAFDLEDFKKLNNSELALKHNLTRERIRQIRARWFPETYKPRTKQAK